MGEKGLYGKYIIEKSNGTPINDFKFVLSPEKDPAAREALRTYAFKTKNTTLSDDLFAWLERIEGGAK